MDTTHNFWEGLAQIGQLWPNLVRPNVRINMIKVVLTRAKKVPHVCKLCYQEVEDTLTFVSDCSQSEDIRRPFLSRLGTFCEEESTKAARVKI